MSVSTYSYLYNEINIINLTINTTYYIIFFLVGFFDDVKQLSPKLRTLILIGSLSVLILLDNNYQIQNLIFKYSDLNFNLGIFSFFFTIFCVFSLFNALNFIDGYNGVSLSIVIYWIIFLLLKNPNLNYLISLIILAIIFYYNVMGKVFLGNSGTNILSIFISLSLILDYNNFQTFYADEILFLLFFPGIDMIRVTAQRIIEGKKIYSPDQSHFHHYLIKRKIKYIWQKMLFLAILPYLLLIITSSTIFSLFFSTMIYIIIYKLIRAKTQS
jgi:UDP-GlcNAc:undecaprenyl-phosphate GlcNAc-1-phosphate transferase